MNAISGYDLLITEEGVKIKYHGNEENTKEITTYYCRYIKKSRKTNKNLKHDASASDKNIEMKITERSHEKKKMQLLRKNLMKEMRSND